MQQLISVVIVNYKVPENLTQALRSLRDAEAYDRIEVIVVDNASNDGSQGIVGAEFPEVKWVQLKANIGFGAACNVGAKTARGEFLLFLNPDALVARTTLSSAVEFMRQHPDVGLLGPKVLNPDGTLQPGCRRGFPTPASAFFHFSGLSRLFPASRRFGAYNLTYLDPNIPCQVAAISGCFMFFRRELFEQVGGFDERFFLYGEDLDICWRIKEKGCKVWYYPGLQIIHLKGKSSAKRVVRSRLAFYEAMILFSRKYQHIHQSFFPRWMIYVGIVILSFLNIGSKIAKSLTAVLIDLALVNTALTISLVLRIADPYRASNVMTMIGVHALLSASFAGMFAFQGLYSRKKYSIYEVLLAGFFATVVFMTCVYFIKFIAFSRVAFGIASLAGIALLIGWRKVLPALAHQLRRIVYAKSSVLIVGNGVVPARVIRNIEQQNSEQVAGVLWTGDTAPAGEFEGYPVLGSIETVAEVLLRVQVDTLLIATPVPWYSLVIEALAKVKAKNLTVRWVPKEIFEKKDGDLPAVIPVHDFSL